MNKRYSYKGKIRRYHWLIDLIKKGGFTIGAEVGTGSGKMGVELLKKCLNLHLYQIAWFPDSGEVHSSPVAKKEWEEKVRQPFYERITVIEKPSVVAAKEVPDQTMDFVFIDAGHSYATVVEDILAWFKKVKVGGLLCGHDYGHPNHPGVKQAVDDVLGYASVIDGTEEDHCWGFRKTKDTL